MNEIDFYKILEVNPSSSIEDIKKSYKRLALKYHPDRNPETENKFKDIKNAYEYLLENHSNKRKIVKNGAFTEMFSEMFRPQQKIKYKQLLNLELSLEEALSGIKKDLQIFLDIPCVCNIITRRECRFCKGLGFIKESKKICLDIPGEIYQHQTFTYKDFYKNIDLQVRINILPSNYFKIRGRNIESEESLNIFKGIIGGDVLIRTLKGTQQIELSPYRIHDFNYILNGMGIQGGNHIIRFKICCPENLTEENKIQLVKILNETENKEN